MPARLHRLCAIAHWATAKALGGWRARQAFRDSARTFFEKIARGVAPARIQILVHAA